jgi:LmbE family N-acetylglucosaminyl deacetylase
MNRDHIYRLLEERVAAGDTEIPGDIDPDDLPDPNDNTFGSPESVITTTVDVRNFLDVKRAAMVAHGSQIQESSFFLKMPLDAFREGFGYEWFIRRGAPPGTHEDDLFAPLR